MAMHVRERRLRLGMTLGDLATEAGVLPDTIRDYETGRRKPSDLTVAKVLSALDRMAQQAGIAAGSARLSIGSSGTRWDTAGTIDNGRKRSSIVEIEQMLSRIDEETGIDAPPVSAGSDGPIEFEVIAHTGARVIVRGTVAEAEALEQSVARLVREFAASGRIESVQ